MLIILLSLSNIDSIISFDCFLTIEIELIVLYIELLIIRLYLRIEFYKKVVLTIYGILLS